MNLLFLLFGILSSGITVAIGAFAAHFLKTKLTTDQLSIFEVGVRYQMYHSLALILLALYMQQTSYSSFLFSGISFIIGILLFSGSLYALALTGIKQLGMITPIGGLLFINGWVLFALSVWNKK